MALKTDIMPMIKFANMYHPSAHQGKSMDKFDVNYIARPQATEVLMTHPLKIQNPLITRAQHTHMPIKELSKLYKQKYGLDGRSFDGRHVSCSEKQLKRDARHIQSLYKHGHSVQKIVISFSTDYLKRKHIINPNLKTYHTKKSAGLLNAGEGFGEIDQLKLRTAIQGGILGMAYHAHFTNPFFNASIQCDTQHIHCHAVLADDVNLSQSQRLVPFRKQKSDFHYPHLEDRGELTANETNGLRHGIDYTLTKTLPMNTMYFKPQERQHNLAQKLEKSTYHDANLSLQWQVVVASLPKNHQLWNYNSHRPIMRRPNQLMNNYLTSVIGMYGNRIGYQRTNQFLQHSINQTPSRNKSILSKTGHHMLYTYMANSLYKNLDRQHPSKLTTRTPYINGQAYDTRELANLIAQSYHGRNLKNTQTILAVYRLNSYKNRYMTHARGFNHDRQILHHIDTLSINHACNENTPIMLRPYYRDRKLAHAKALDKYRFILKMQPQLSSLAKQKNRQAYQTQMQGYRYFQGEPKRTTTRQPAKFKQVNTLLKDKNFHKVLNEPLQRHGQMTLRIELESYKSNPYKPYSKMTMTALSQIGHAEPSKYNHLTNEIYNSRGARKQTRLLPKDNTIYNRYAYYLADYADNQFSQGTISAQQLAQQDYQHIRHNPVIKPTQPSDNPVSPLDFELDKGVDLDSCEYDVAPHDDRKVSKDTANDFEQSTQEQEHSTRLAWEYTQVTRQSLRVLMQMKTRWLKAKKRHQLAKQIKSSHQLPEPAVMQTALVNHRQRNVATINLSTAYDGINDHLEDLSNANQEFVNNLSENPNQIFHHQQVQQQNSEPQL